MSLVVTIITSFLLAKNVHINTQAIITTGTVFQAPIYLKPPVQSHQSPLLKADSVIFNKQSIFNPLISKSEVK